MVSGHHVYKKGILIRYVSDLDTGHFDILLTR